MHRSLSRSTTAAATSAGSHPHDAARPRARGGDLAGQLARDWARLARSRAALATANRWRLVASPVSHLDDVLRAAGYGDVRQRGREGDRFAANEAVLRRLVELAADDELAARVVLERIVPGLLAAARKRRAANGFDDLVATAWIVIRTFDLRRRPASLAAALISDADYRVFRLPWRRASAGEVGLAESHLANHAAAAATDPTEPARTAIDELAEIVALGRASGAVDGDDVELVRLLVVEPRAVDVARLLQVTPRTVRNRRDRITIRLRNVAEAA